MSTWLLGVDIGTSSCKTALFDPEGRVRAAGGSEYPVSYPEKGWAEPDLFEHERRTYSDDETADERRIFFMDLVSMRRQTSCFCCSVRACFCSSVAFMKTFL